MTSLFVLTYGEKVSTDTVQLSRDFMQALITMDEKTIETIKHPDAGSGLSEKYFLNSEHKALKTSAIKIEELQFIIEKGKQGRECVIVKSTNTRKTSFGLLPIHWRLGFEKSKDKENLKLLYLDSIYEANGYNDNGCW